MKKHPLFLNLLTLIPYSFFLTQICKNKIFLNQNCTHRLLKILFSKIEVSQVQDWTSSIWLFEKYLVKEALLNEYDFSSSKERLFVNAQQRSAALLLLFLTSDALIDTCNDREGLADRWLLSLYTIPELIGTIISHGHESI